MTTHTDLIDLYQRRRSETRERWDRDLPLDELLFDRWERARNLGFGDGASIYHMAYVYGDVKVGEHTWIGPFTMLDGSGGLEIGSWCSISTGVQVYSHDTVDRSVSGGQAETDRTPTVIEDCVYIGAGTVVARGVRIGSHSIIGAHSFVNRDVEPYSIMAGSPIHRLGRVEIDGSSVRRIYQSLVDTGGR